MSSVPPGYKQTEVGVIPEEWIVDKLDNLARVIDSLHQTPSFIDDGYPMVRVTDIKTGNLSLNGTMKVSEAIFSEFTKNYKPKRNDIVLSRVGSYGVSSFVETDAPFCMGQNTVVIQPKLSPRYLYYVLNSPSIRRQIDDGSYGSGYKSLSLRNIKELLIPTPSADGEQRAIAAALSDVDALIASLDKLIAKKRDMKQAAMQELLTGKRRLPGFSGEWEVKRLGDVCEISMGRTPSRRNPAYWGKGYKWLSIADLQQKVISESKEEITELAASEMPIIPKGTLLMSFKLSIGRLCFAGCDLFTNEAICSFNKLQANADYLYYALGRVDFSLYGKQAVKGYTLNKESLKLVEVSYPPLPEQTAIAAILSDMDTEIAALEQKRDKTRLLKQGMMQELLTGRIRLV